jgi:hypothetical protein
MTKEQFAAKVECEGWEYALTEISPSQLADAGLAEALADTQEAFKILVDATPEVEVTFVVDEEDEDRVELDFG